MKITIDIPDEVVESGAYCAYYGAWSKMLQEALENGERRKTGRWKYNTVHGYYGCTNCNHRLGFGAVLDLGGLPCACPWCDAKMEEVE